jgi:hypothetical protein
VKPRSVRAALDHLLMPFGFIRDGEYWTRYFENIEEAIHLQKSNTLGLTVNIHSVDNSSKRMLIEGVGPKAPSLYYWVSVRIGALMDNYDHWWKAGPQAIEEIPRLVSELALPFLEKMRSPAEQADRFGRRAVGEPGPRHIPSALKLAITLYRMGEKEEACRALVIPKRRTETAVWAAQVPALRAYLGCPHMDGLAGS